MRMIGASVAAAVTALVLGAVGAAHAARTAPPPFVAITGMQDGFVATPPALGVTVQFRANAAPGGIGRGPSGNLSAVALTLDGVEVGRTGDAAILQQGTHTFQVNLAGRPAGPGVLQALAVHRGVTAGRGIRRSRPVTIAVDADVSDGVVVGPAGGSVSTADGRLTMVIPPGALAGPQTITVGAVDPATLPPIPGAQPAFAFQLGPDGLQFSRPAEVRLRLDGSPVRPDGTIDVRVVPLVSLSAGTVEVLVNQRLLVDATARTAVARGLLSHFSTLVGLDPTIEVRLEVEGVPDALEVGDAFFVTVAVTDTVATNFQSDRVTYGDSSTPPIMLTFPLGQTVLGSLARNQADTLIRTGIRYVCTAPGFGSYGGGIVLETVAFPVGYTFGILLDGESDDYGIAVFKFIPCGGVAVPSLIGLTQGEVGLALALVGLRTGTVTFAPSATVPAGQVISQTPAAGTRVPADFPVDFVISQGPGGGGPGVTVNPSLVPLAEALTRLAPGLFGLGGLLQAPAAAPGPVPQAAGERIAIAGSTGFVALEAQTGQVAMAGTVPLDFRGFDGARFVALGLRNPAIAGQDAFLSVGPGGLALRHFFPDVGDFGFTQLGALNQNVTDAVHFGGDPAFAGALYANNAAGSRGHVGQLVFDQPSGLFQFAPDPLIATFAFQQATGRVVSAFSFGPASPVIVVTDGTPGQIFLANPATPNDPATLVGAAGDSPRRVRCRSGLCAVSNFGGDTLTIVRWDGSSMTATIAGTVAVGDGPVGIDLTTTGGNVAAASTGFNGQTYTVTVLSPADGSVVTNTTTAVPAACVNPGHALWLGTSLAFTCNGSNNYVIIAPGLP
jgi:hypothetical protein